jgi:putative copper resistance protein D
MLVLVLVGACGAAHRRWTIRAVRQGRTAGFLRLARGESLVMGLGIGLGVVLGRTTPPVGALTRAAPAHASAYPTVEAGLGPVDSSSLLLHVRPDALVLTTLVAAGAGAVWWRRRHCPDWSLRRLLVLQLGLVMVLWALCGGLGTYAVALVSAQVGQLMVLTLVAPTLIVLGAPPNLSGILPRRVVQRSEVDGLLAVVTVLLLVWCTPLLEVVLARPTARVLLALTCVVCGLALVGPLLSRWGHRRDPGVVLVVLATVLLTEAVQLGRPGGAVAGGWFVRLDWWWSDPVRDQRVAALIFSVSAATLRVAGCSTLLWDRWHRGVRIPGSDHA